MITVTITPQAVTIRGHTNAAEKGKDIVCATVASRATRSQPIRVSKLLRKGEYLDVFSGQEMLNKRRKHAVLTG